MQAKQANKINKSTNSNINIYIVYLVYYCIAQKELHRKISKVFLRFSSLI
jgi:hypothetical protein